MSIHNLDSRIYYGLDFEVNDEEWVDGTKDGYGV